MTVRGWGQDWIRVNVGMPPQPNLLPEGEGIWGDTAVCGALTRRGQARS